MVQAEVADFVGYPCTGTQKAADLWCAVDVPPEDWALKSCPTGTPTTPVKVLTYNLFWWNLFDMNHGSERSAGRLIARTSQQEPYDFMAFQECDDRERVLMDARDSGLQGEYETIDGGRAIAMAYRTSSWRLLDHGSADVGEDSRDQYYGRRAAMWGRFEHREDGKTVLFMNHHGPLKVSQGGGCTGSATALNILRVIGKTAHKGDAIILVGDFNAQAWSSRIKELEKHLGWVFSGTAMGGVDHIYSNCASRAQAGQDLGKGDGWKGSDHDALSVTFTI